MKENINDINLKVFNAFKNDWALLTSGSFENHNSMTIAWGAMGTLWQKDVITVYVKPVRHTYSFMEKNDYFVVSFFAEEYKEALKIMGRLSGRDVNKDELSKLTPIKDGDNVIYKEAKLTFICKKIYYNDIVLDSVPCEEIKKYYQVEEPHRMYVGEVIKVIEND